MAERGAPLGNTNGTKGRPWTGAIEAALAKRSRVERKDALEAIAAQVLDMAQGGDMEAIKEIGNRLEGKARQITEIVGAGGGPLQLETIVREGLRGKVLAQIDIVEQTLVAVEAQ